MTVVVDRFRSLALGDGGKDRSERYTRDHPTVADGVASPDPCAKSVSCKDRQHRP